MGIFNLNHFLALFLKLTTLPFSTKDAVVSLVISQNTACVAELIHHKGEKDIRCLHIFDWPFAELSTLSPASLSAAGQYLSEQIEGANIISKYVYFILPAEHIYSQTVTLPFI